VEKSFFENVQLILFDGTKVRGYRAAAHGQALQLVSNLLQAYFFA
jgi:hypothetical protein